MRWMARIRTALADLLRRGRFEREMDEELRTFLELEAAEGRRGGAGRGGTAGIEGIKDALRDLRAGAALESVAMDLRFSARSLGRRPGFAAAVILTIALGILPLTAILGLANGLFFRAAPGVTGADSLVQVEFGTRSQRGFGRASLSYLNYADLMNSQRVFSGLAGYAATSVSIAAQGTEARRISGSFVMHNYFDVLGVRMAVGRSF